MFMRELTEEKERRVLISQSNNHLIPLLSSVLLRTLADTGKDCTEGKVLDILNGSRNSLGYICRHCYYLLSSYYKKDQSVKEKVKKVIELVTFRNSDSLANSSYRSVNIGTKRFSKDSTQTQSSKKPKKYHAAQES